MDRAVVAEPAAADERALFPVLAAAFFRDRQRALTGVRSGGALKFGVDEAAVLLTPVMLETARVVWEYLVEDTTRRGITWTGETGRRLFGAKPAPLEAEQPSDTARLSLTVEQWGHVHQLVTQVLTGPGKIPAGRASLLADAVVGRGLLGEDRQA